MLHMALGKLGVARRLLAGCFVVADPKQTQPGATMTFARLDLLTSVLPIF